MEHGGKCVPENAGISIRLNSVLSQKMSFFIFTLENRRPHNRILIDEALENLWKK